ncbi:nucleotidyltransferase family protein [Polaribacter sp. Z022]|uniref:nucleotidyltransferase family protein n=1 Tax=Polaribacter sp. Z022 TaxID=2927125 RepID=UPI00202291C2|nr:nucleotidyltransferase family protein [Polaribacter sp. Z022]MCL7755034.1 nucleotidyltransferase family protein [Polaribacter sp. Z022]
MDNMNSIAVLVLAAGKSSRMKDIKQLLKINNKTLLETALENGKKINPDNVICVLGAHAEKIKKETSTKNITYIFNNNFEKGLSSSIVCGVNYIAKEHSNLTSILILLADQPKIDFQFLNELVSIYQKNTTKIVASSYGDKKGVPAIFPKIYFEKLKLLKGDKGAKEFLNSNNIDIASINSLKLIDIDTKEDYINFLK